MSSNSNQLATLGSVFRAGIVGPDGKITPEFQKKLQEWDNKLRDAINLLGEISKISKNAIITGRTEGIGTTVQHLDSAGVTLAAGVDFSRSYVNKTIDNVPDGSTFARTTFNQRNGGGRAFTALDTNSRLVSGFYNNAVNDSFVPTSATALSNNGIATAISIGATTAQYDFGTVSYNSGSVDPGVFGTFYIYADDSTFAGGAVSYQFTTTPSDQVANPGRVFFGRITTSGGTPETGGGYSGGTGGSGGGHGYGL